MRAEFSSTPKIQMGKSEAVNISSQRILILTLLELQTYIKTELQMLG